MTRPMTPCAGRRGTGPRLSCPASPPVQPVPGGNDQPCRTRSVIRQCGIVIGSGPGEHAERFRRPRRRVAGMSAPDSSIEIERKFAVEAGFVLPDLTAVSGVASVAGPDTYHLTAVYLDTPGLDLAAARITLRRRTGGTDAGWHLKLPAGTETRREVHVPLGPGGEPVPDDLAGLVADQVHGQPLRPIARLQTTRTVRRLTDAAGQVLAE